MMRGQLTVSFLVSLLAVTLIAYVLLGALQDAGNEFKGEALRAELKARADLAAALVNLVYLQGGALSYNGAVPKGAVIEGCEVRFDEEGAEASASCLAPNASASGAILVSGKRKWFR